MVCSRVLDTLYYIQVRSGDRRPMADGRRCDMLEQALERCGEAAAAMKMN